MSCKWLIGSGDWLEHVWLTWVQAHPAESVKKLELTQGPDYAFDLSSLPLIDRDTDQVFVAFDERFGNYKRAELMQLLLLRGYRTCSFVHPTAELGEGVRIGASAFVGPRVVLSHGCRVDHGAVLQAGVLAGDKVRVKSFCWIERGVALGPNVQVGGHATLRMGASVAAGVVVGSDCELDWPRRYDADIKPGTVFDRRYDQPIVVYGR